MNGQMEMTYEPNNDLVVKLNGVLPDDRDRPKDFQRHASVEHMPAKDVIKTLEAVTRFVSDTSNEKNPIISFRDGSFEIVVSLPYESATMIRSAQDGNDTNEAYMRFLRSLTEISEKSGWEMSLRGAGQDLTKDFALQLTPVQHVWTSVVFSVIGRINNMGGKKPNIHIRTSENEEYIINLTIEQAQELTVYKIYQFEVEGKRDAKDADSKPTDLTLLCWEEYEIQEITLEEYKRRQYPNWKGVDPVTWVRNLRDSQGEIESNENQN